MDIDRHEPGTFCWFELATTDQNAAKDFYTKMFGWTPDDVPMGDGAFYTMLKLRGRDVAALYKAQPGQPPAWGEYVAVTSADAAAEKAKSLGGTVALPPFDVFDAGRMAVLQDPAGAFFSLWQPKQNPGVGIFGEVNAVCWSELATTDVEGAKKFYGDLFGWKMKTGDPDGPMPYTELSIGERGFGGMYKMPPQMQGVPPNWMPYFAVDDTDGFVTKATSAGASTMVPPTDIPNVGRFSVIRDPQGAVFAVIRLQM
jgi:predicted enzyme related to lactoylglutathione lyase